MIYAINQGKNLEELSLLEYKEISDVFDTGIYDAISVEACVSKRNVSGGPSKEYMEKYLAEAAVVLEELQ